MQSVQERIYKQLTLINNNIRTLTRAFLAVSFSSNTVKNYTNFLVNGFLIPIQILIQNLGIILRVVIKVKINVLFAGPLSVVVRLALTALRRILVRAPVLLGIRVLIILLVIILRQKRRILLLLLVLKLLSYSFSLFIKQLYIVHLQYFQNALVLEINFILQGCLILIL